MKKILDTIIFAEYSVQDLLIFSGVVVVFLIVIGILKRVFKKKEINKHFQFVECFSCGWKGKVSRYIGRCPKCNQPLGEQKAQRRR
jgi:hypothetical protein